LAAPGIVARAFGLGDTPATRVAARHLAARDLVAGVGILLAERRGQARGWYEAAALVDAVDAGIALAAGRSGSMSPGRARLVAVLAGGSAAAGLVLARQSSPSPS
jgi:hypothetical protein